MEARRHLSVDQLIALEEAVGNTQRSASLATRIMRQALPLPVTIVCTGFVQVLGQLVHPAAVLPIILVTFHCLDNALSPQSSPWHAQLSSAQSSIILILDSNTILDL